MSHQFQPSLLHQTPEQAICLVATQATHSLYLSALDAAVLLHAGHDAILYLNQGEVFHGWPNVNVASFTTHGLGRAI